MNLCDLTTEDIVAPPLRVRLCWQEGVLHRISLDWADSAASSAASPASRLSPLSASLRAALVRYLEGEQLDWSQLKLDYALVPPFAATVLETLRREIGHGETISYGELAALCGRKGAARAVGGAMAANPWPLLVPCHRVVGADGRLVGFAGAGLPMKSFLLRLEGALDADGKLNKNRRRSTSRA